MKTLPIRIRLVHRAVALMLAASSIYAVAWVAAAGRECAIVPVRPAIQNAFEDADDVLTTTHSERDDRDSRDEAKPDQCLRLMAIVCNEVRYDLSADVFTIKRLPRSASASAQFVLKYKSHPLRWIPRLEVLFSTWQL